MVLNNFYYDNTIQNQNLFNPASTGNLRDENKSFETDTGPVEYREKYTQNNPCYLQMFQVPIRYLAVKLTQQRSC